MPVMMRRAELDDQQAITALIGKDSALLRRRFGRYKVLSLIENSFLSVTAVDDNNQVVGFACFEDVPNLECTAEAFYSWFKDTYDKKDCCISNCLFLTFYAVGKDNEDEVAEMTLKTAFTTLPQIDYAISLIADDIEPFGVLQSNFQKLAMHPAADPEKFPFPSMQVLCCDRSLLIANLKIRVARVEDHDDLVPVFDSQSEVLTELFGEFFLAEMIQAQDDQNKALVAVVDNSCVGLMSLSSEMDVDVLQQCFELDVYDNLVKMPEEKVPDPEEEARIAAEKKAVLDAALKALCPKILVKGPPTWGVSETAKSIAVRYCCPYLSGSEIAEALAADEEQAESEAGMLAKALKENNAVPDETEIVKLIVARLGMNDCAGAGWVLDGSNLSKSQVEALAADGVKFETMFEVAVNDEEVLRRAAGRRTDPETGKIYEDVENNPPEEEVLARLEQKEGESEAELAPALAEYAENLAQLREWCQESRTAAEAEATGETTGEAKAAVLDETEAGAAAPKAAVEVIPGQDGWEDEVCNTIENTKGFLDPTVEEEVEEEEDTGPVCNAFAITLFCLDESYDSRSGDFLEHAFNLFPERDYCLLTLPPTSAESTVLSSFTLVPQRSTSAFSHVLYLVHRSALFGMRPGMLTVRRADKPDYAGLEAMLENMGEAGADVLAEVKGSECESDIALADNPSSAAFVMEVANQLIGVAVLDRNTCSTEDVNWLKANYHIEDFVLFSEHRSKSQAFLRYFVINPIFHKFSRFVLKELMRHYCKSLVYLRLYPGSSIPSVLPEFVQVKPRRLAQLSPEQTPQATVKLETDAVAQAARGRKFSLQFLTHKLLSEPKLVNNSRIVVVGGSDEALSFLETLLLVPYLHFTNLILLAPGGLPSGHEDHFNDGGGKRWLPTNAAGYSQEEMDKVGFRSRVRVVDGKLVALDRDGQAAILPDGSCLPYDYLVLATGLQDATSRAVGMLEPEQARGVYFLTDAVAEQKLTAAIEEYNNEGPIVVYGTGMDALCVVNTLIESNVRPDNVMLLRSGPAPESGSLLGNEYMDECAMQEINRLGVRVHHLQKIVGVEEKDGGVTAYFRENGDKDAESVSVDCQLLVCADEPDVDQDLFQAVNGSGLVYDGRLVVDLRFCTTDPSIYGGGSLCKFSRRYRNAATLENFNAREVGARLAQAVLQVVDPLSADTSPPTEVPTFRLPRARCGKIPSADGPLYFARIELPLLPEKVRNLVTKLGADNEKTGYSCLQVDSHGRVSSFSYMGSEAVEVSNLCCLVGMQESYLNSAVAFFNKGMVKDWIAFFREDWASALYHDRFHDFCLSLRMGMQDDEGVRDVLEVVRKTLESGAADQEICQVRREAVGIGGSALAPSTKKMVEMHLLEFLKNNRNLLPMYWPGPV